jgi:hypothetical protein
MARVLCQPGAISFQKKKLRQYTNMLLINVNIA